MLRDDKWGVLDLFDNILLVYIRLRQNLTFYVCFVCFGKINFYSPVLPIQKCHSATLYLPCHNYHNKSRMNTLMAANFISHSAYRCLQHVWWPTLSFLLPWELLKQLREGFPYLACHPLQNVFFSDFQPWFGDIKDKTILASVISYRVQKWPLTFLLQPCFCGYFI